MDCYPIPFCLPEPTNPRLARAYKPRLNRFGIEKRRLRIYRLWHRALGKHDPSINGERSNGVSPPKYLTVAELFTLQNQSSPLPLFISLKFSVSASLPTFINGPTLGFCATILLSTYHELSVTQLVLFGALTAAQSAFEILSHRENKARVCL
jgi:hypothetical protein